MSHRKVIRTHTGKMVNPLALKQEDICIEDIAHHLSNICRFTGAVDSFYSVAQHAVYVSMNCNKEHAWEGLHHDDAEAYLLDVASPVKHSWQFFPYRVYERLAENEIQQRYRTKGIPEDVKRADGLVFEVERQNLFSCLGKPIPPYLKEIYTPAEANKVAWFLAWPPQVAKVMYLRRFRQLVIEREEYHLLSDEDALAIEFLNGKRSPNGG